MQHKQVAGRPEWKSFDTRILVAKSMDLHPDLIGTAWDPVFADGSPVKSQPPVEHKHVVRIVSFDA
jgi:hypothetical protein